MGSGAGPLSVCLLACLLADLPVCMPACVSVCSVACLAVTSLYGVPVLRRAPGGYYPKQRCIDLRTYVCALRSACPADGWMDGWIDGWMDGWGVNLLLLKTFYFFFTLL